MRPAVGAGQETREELHQSLQTMKQISARNRAAQKTVKTNRNPVKDAINQSSNLAGSVGAVMDSYAPKSKPFFSDKLSNLSKGAKIGKISGLSLAGFVGAINAYSNFNSYGFWEASFRTGIDLLSIGISYALASFVAGGIIATGLTAIPAIALTVATGVVIGYSMDIITNKLKKQIFE